MLMDRMLMELIPAGIFALILVVVVITDLRKMIIPDSIIWPGMGILVVLRIWIHPLPFWNYVIAALIGGGVILVVAWFSQRILHISGVGGGDIKLFTLVGVVLGVKLTLLSLFMASLLGSVAGLLFVLLRILIKRVSNNGINDSKSAGLIPFAPFIAAGSVVSYLWGDRIVDAYLNILFTPCILLVNSLH